MILFDGGTVTSGSSGPELRLDCAGLTVRHGAVNAHTHLYSGLAPLGLPAPKDPPQNFVQILERVWWKLDRALDARTLKASARFALADALLHGTTALIDHHESPGFIEGSLDVLADAAEELGVRLAVCYGATERNEGRAEGKRGLAECERFVRSNRRARVRGLVALHASFTVSDDTVRESGALARQLSVPMHVHVAEDGADVVDAKQRGYAGPLERLMQLGALPAGSIVAHGVHLDEAQVRELERSGVWLVQNPRSNEGNKVGYAKALRASAHVALGTDGWPADMDLETAALFRLGRENGDGDEVLRARRDRSQALATTLFGPLDDFVAGRPGEKPRHVAVGGRLVVRDGVLQTADFEEIRAKALEAAPELWRRMR